MLSSSLCSHPTTRLKGSYVVCKSKTSSLTSAFTIVELLIVVVVIAILAAITIVSFNGITNSANDALIKSGLNTAVKKISLYKIKNGSYPSSLIEIEDGIELLSSSVASYVYGGEKDSFCIQAAPRNNLDLMQHATEDGTVSQGGCASASESCFEFNPTTGTITDYYDHENNNAAMPRCPRALFIPKQINGVDVSILGQNSFSGSQLTAAYIPNSVNKISIAAFSNNAISSANIPEGLAIIETAIFNSNRLTYIDIPDSVTAIETASFGINQIEQINWGKSLTSIGAGAFSNGLSDVKSVPIVIPNTVNLLDYSAFSHNNISDLYIPKSVTSIQTSTFGGSTISNMTIDSPNIGSVWFGNGNIKHLVVGDSVKTIGQSAFSNAQIQTLSLGSSVESIDTAAFASNQITSVTIPNSVTSIATAAFYSNPSITCRVPNGSALGTVEQGCVSRVFY